jgi:hypothetical protein
MSKYAKQLLDIGLALGPIAQQIFLLNDQIDRAETSIAFLKLTLTPEIGWPGKNEAERNIARDVTFSTNPGLVSAQHDLANMRHSLAELKGMEALHESNRRALEFAVRDRLASVLIGYDDDMDAVQNREQVDPLVPLTEGTPKAPELQSTANAKTIITDGKEIKVPDWHDRIPMHDALEGKIPANQISAPDWEHTSVPAPTPASPVVDDIFGSTTGRPMTLAGDKGYHPPVTKLPVNPANQDLLKGLTND